MPTTPPIILPSTFPTWFNPSNKTESPTRLEEFQLLNDGDISTFSYSPSEDDELLDELNDKQPSNHSSQRTTHELYHKPVSYRNSQQQNTNQTGTNEHYQLDDDQMDATQGQRQHSQQPNRNEQNNTETQTQCDEDNLFESTMDRNVYHSTIDDNRLTCT